MRGDNEGNEQSVHNETRRESNEFGMNFVEIEEHQVGDLVFAQLHYLYISLRPHQPMLLYQ